MEENIGIVEDVSEGSFDIAISRLSEKLSTTGYAREGSAEYIRVVRHFCFWHARHAMPGEVDESKTKKFIDHLSSCTCPVPGRGSYRLCHAALRHFLSVLREMGLASPPVPRSVLPEDTVLQRFREHLTKVHGAAESTALLYVRHLRPFLQGIYRDGQFAFQDITARDIASSVMQRAVLHKPKTVKLYCSSLRAFFRFLRLTGELEFTLADAVPAVPHWSLSTIPKYLREEQLNAFLSSFKVNTLVGLRGRAMALLMATVGLRAGEVADLTLEDIDWRKSSIRLSRTKSRRIDYLPLTTEAGEALAEYLKKRSPTLTRHVFVSLITPVGRPVSSSTVSGVIRRAFKRCFPGEPTHGPHVLRHTLATRMLREGATFKEIADILRHQNIESTAIYAKVDLKGLEHVMLPWPEVMP